MFKLVWMVKPFRSEPCPLAEVASICGVLRIPGNPYDFLILHLHKKPAIVMAEEARNFSNHHRSSPIRLKEIKGL
jgi:hypothetical protein